MACEQVTLQDVCELIVDCPHTSAKDEGVGYPLIRTPNVGRGRLILTDVHRVSQDVYERRVSRAVPRQGDLILAREAPAGNVAIVSPGIEVCLGQRTMLLRPDSSFVVPEYLNYYLNAPEQRDRMLRLANGATVSHINVADIRNMPVQLPSRGEQSKVAELLNVLDDKIDLNNRLNDYLEQCLLARYDHLFRGAGTYNGTISDIGDVVGGATPSKKRPEYYCHEGIGWITPKDLSNTTNKFVAHGADDITRVGFDSCSIKKLPAGTVLFSSRAPIGYIAIASDEVTTNQGFKSIVPHKEIGTAFVYCFLVRNKDRIADAGSGTTFPEVSGKTMAGIELTLPNINLCAKFEEWASPLLEEQRHLEDENRQLEDLRDTLLPKLMSGEIDVSKVDFTQLTNNHLSGCGSFCSVCCPSGLASEFHEWFREHFSLVTVTYAKQIWDGRICPKDTKEEESCRLVVTVIEVGSKN